ncbi:hypothetical protein HOP50_13g68980 [Chloropicon primus]|uniref:Uncharacterized protein n=1 Tax=Chloropicon primus TaxID=1764295 RepID=A0A5B8MXY1_9CHLO|nr:hypothetical protein A3770_13p68780 [Chloropicon primus]UPR03568.1 hypothetical protein HOP50_13g68980 [Chloropicon primus]|eukprot:QDZ24360.1 hypothetical protein A3770_13p68780 [Chloropicon primus]
MAPAMRPLYLAVACLFFASPFAFAAEPRRDGAKTFSVLSRPVKLKYGEVHNTIQDPIKLPKEIVDEFASDPIAIVNYDVDIVTMDEATGEERQVPLYAGYNHHYAMGIGPYEMMKKYYEAHKNDPYGGYELNTTSDVHSFGSAPVMKRFMSDMAGLGLPVPNRRGRRAANFGGGSGAEERGTSHLLPSPYAHVVDTPQALIPLIHLINTKGSERNQDGYSPLLECPCTPQRSFDLASGEIDGRPPVPPFSCNLKFDQEENPSCFMDIYEGGFRCCEHGVFVIDTDVYPPESLPETTFYFKFNFEYESVAPSTLEVRPPACCDVTANLTVGGNIEYDVPACTAGVAAEDCVHEMTSSQFFDLMPNYHSNETRKGDVDPETPVDLVYAVGHLHVGGLSLDLYNDETGELICHSVPKYGTGEEAGNEKGYLVGMTSCTFDPPVRMTKETVVRTVARYNNTINRHGVMALWLMEVSDPKPAAF